MFNYIYNWIAKPTSHVIKSLVLYTIFKCSFFFPPYYLLVIYIFLNKYMSSYS